MKQDITNDFIATIERKEGRYFVLKFSDLQELKVPIHRFARSVHEGERIHVQFLTPSQARATKTELAQSILEEILNGE